MHDPFELDHRAKGAAEHAGKQLARRLNTALGPAPLLHQECGGCARKLGRDAHLVAQDEAPARHLRPVADVEVLDQRVVMPSARFLECASAPQPRRSVELEEPSTPVPSPLLHQEVAVEQQRLGAGQPRFVFVEVVPARLHHAGPGIGHRGKEVVEEPGRGDEIGVENEDVVTGRRFETRGEGARLVAVAVGAVEDGDVDAFFPPLAGARPGEGGGVVGGVVEDLDLEEVAGVGEAAGGVDEALDDVLFVVDGELDGDAGEVAGGGWGPGVGLGTARQPQEGDPVGGKGEEQEQHGAVERDRGKAEHSGHSGSCGFVVEGPLPDRSGAAGSNPRQSSTGSGGYLRKVGSSR